MNFADANAPTVLMRKDRRSRASMLSIAGLELPAELLHDARERVRRIVIITLPFSLIMGAGWLLAGLFGFVSWEAAWRLPATSAVAIIISGALFFAGRSQRIGDAAIIYLALAFYVVLAGLAGLGHASHEYERFSRVTPFGPYTITIVLFPLLLPVPPRLILISSLTASLSVVLGMLIAENRELAVVPQALLFEVAALTTACALIAYIGSRLLYRLQAEVVAARRLGSYELTELIGKGGMGEVWVGRHRLLARPAAVKLIRPEALAGTDVLSKESVHERFTREAKATAALESPHTIRLFDFGVTDDGALYYAMELLDGIDLDTMVATYGPLPPARVASLLAQVCDSIAEAHDVGLLHRDIKPANIMTCRVGRGFDFVKVLDFGLVTERENPDMKLTRAGMMVGTPGYMAPEILLGAPADPRSDIYALGCVAYRLLTGQPVFDATDIGSVSLKHVSDPVAPPSTHGVELPIALEALVIACLAKRPDDRPQTIDAVGAVLRSHATAWDQEQAKLWWSSAKAPRKRNVTISATR